MERWRRIARGVRLAWLALLGVAIAPAPAIARDLVVGVSWSHFQEERWKTDERALRDELARLGAKYVSADAQSSSEKQISDVEGLLARGVDALLIVAQDADAIGPVVRQAQSEGVPVVAYDRLIELPGVVYLSFDNVEVGRLQARAIFEEVPRGRYVFIKGSPQDPNADFVHAGQLEVLAAAIERGDIQVVGDQYVDGWLPEGAQRTTEQILTANANRVDAIVCSNDGMASGVAAALASQGLEGLPLSGQDGDHAALHRVALGHQTVSVWKDARALGRVGARTAVQLARGVDPASLEGVRTWKGGTRGLELPAILLTPVPVTRDRLGLVIDAGWVSRETVCRGVDELPGEPPSACR